MNAQMQVTEASKGLLELEVMLPSQHFRAPRKQAPEQRLMIAVLHDALECLEKYRFSVRSEGRRLFDEARLWFLAHETRWPFSFERICAVLDLDSDAVLQHLRGALELQPVAASAGSPELPARGSANRRHGTTAAGRLWPRLVTMDADRQMAEMEDLFRSAGDPRGQMEALATLRRWQLDPRLDSASRQRLSALVWKFEPNGWDEV